MFFRAVYHDGLSFWEKLWEMDESFVALVDCNTKLQSDCVILVFCRESESTVVLSRS